MLDIKDFSYFCPTNSSFLEIFVLRIRNKLQNKSFIIHNTSYFEKEYDIKLECSLEKRDQKRRLEMSIILFKLYQIYRVY